jgi:hypothetical protein
VTWTNKVSVRHRFFQEGDSRRCELQPIPTGSIKYTTDGSGPENNGAVYTAPFVVPASDRFVLAIAEADGVRSELTKFDIPRESGETVVTVDGLKSATWKRKFQKDSTGDSYEWLQIAAQHNAELGGVALQVAHEQRWVEFRSETNVFLASSVTTEEATRLRDFLQQGNVSLEVEMLRFPTGQDLLDMVKDLKTELRAGEVTQ